MIVNLPINPIKRTGAYINWILKAREWSFPHPPPRPGEIYFERNYSFEELEKRRFYLDIEAIPFDIYIRCEKYKDIDLEEQGGFRRVGDNKCIFVWRVNVLLEIIDGKLVIPELESWKPYVIRTSWTDALRFYKMRDATEFEADMFLSILGYRE